MRKTRLLILTTTYPRWNDDHEPGFVHELSKRLVDHFDVTVVAPHAPGANRQETMDGVQVLRFRYAPDRFETLAYSGGIANNLKHNRLKYLLLQGFLLGFFFAALNAVRRQSIEVVHAHWLIPGGMIGAALKILFPRLRFVVTAHGADVFQLRKPFFASLRRWVSNEADAITVVGKSLSNRAAQEGWMTPKLTIAPMGVDLTNTFHLGQRAHDRPTLVFAGRLTEKKGMQQLLEAMPLIREQIPNIRLLVAGHGPLEIRLEKRSRALGLAENVNFLGAYRNAELPAIFGRGDIAVLPFQAAPDGDEEGFGLTTVEAMGCGLPVIVGNVPAVRDIIVHGESGWMLESTLPDCIANAITHLLENPSLAQELAVNGRMRAERLFDWSVAAQRYEDVLTGTH